MTCVAERSPLPERHSLSLSGRRPETDRDPELGQDQRRG